MNPLDFLEPEEQLQFFHCHKTELSLLENPFVFLSKLRDHNLIPEDKYQKIICMKSKDNIKRALYDLMDWVEKKKSEHIALFWSCVFKETIMNQYYPLKLMYNSLMDGSYRASAKLPEKVEETDEGKRKKTSEDEKDEGVGVEKKRRSFRSKCVSSDEEEQPGPSSKQTPDQRRKSKRIPFSSPIKRGEKAEIWTWPIYKTQLPVSCGDQEGTLSRDRLAKGEKCITAGRKWFTPAQFEKFSGKERCRNWKQSIKCKGVPLQRLIEDGHLKATPYQRGAQKNKVCSSPGDSITVSDGEEDDEDDEDDEDEEEEDEDASRAQTATGVSEEEEQMEVQPGVSPEVSRKVFRVTCEAEHATLHAKRFASGTCGKSIRTDATWMTPVEFVRSASRAETSWRKAIKCDGNPISVLIEAKLLQIHQLTCPCKLCRPEQKDKEDDKNDDECCICKKEGNLVLCDQCPRAFHQTCHLPHLRDTDLQSSRLWMCTFCVFRTTQDWMYRDERRREEAMSRQTSQHMLECQYLLLFLSSADEEQVFATNPTLHLEDSSSGTSSPTWLGKIADKLQEKLYQTVREFVSDVQLIFTDCASHNRENAEVLAEGDRLKELFNEELKRVFNIQE